MAEPTKKRARVDDEASRPLHVVVWTDGACTNNGQRGARAGVGVFFGARDPRNLSERLVGRQTNQRAELTAAIRAVQLLNTSYGDDERVRAEIVSDSKYVIDGITQWVLKWRARQWRIKNQNIDLWRRLDELVCNTKHTLCWRHVPGHSGVFGNEQADQLACQGALLPPPMSPLVKQNK